MANLTSIEWTDVSWQVTRGCSRVSPGCGGARGEGSCYAEGIASRFSGPGQVFEGFAVRGKGWTRKVSPLPQNLAEPLSWKKPRRVFVNSMSDLFHEDVPNEYIAAVFGVMAACPQHTFQVLTKRAERMAAWFEWLASARQPWPTQGPPGWLCHEHARRQAHGDVRWMRREDTWPLPNVWIGVSVEDQKRADERIPHLLRVPAAVRFLSCEPLIGPVDLGRVAFPDEGVAHLDALRGAYFCDGLNEPRRTPRIDWVIVGGESGLDARPFDLAWARSIVAQCREADVACFVKQLGARPEIEEGAWFARDARGVRADIPLALRDRKGGDMAEWPEDLRIRQWPAGGAR